MPEKAGFLLTFARNKLVPLDCLPLADFGSKHERGVNLPFRYFSFTESVPLLLCWRKQ
jgi:hypothetical protein